MVQYEADVAYKMKSTFLNCFIQFGGIFQLTVSVLHLCTMNCDQMNRPWDVAKHHTQTKRYGTLMLSLCKETKYVTSLLFSSSFFHTFHFTVLRIYSG